MLSQAWALALLCFLLSLWGSLPAGKWGKFPINPMEGQPPRKLACVVGTPICWEPGWGVLSDLRLPRANTRHHSQMNKRQFSPDYSFTTACCCCLVTKLCLALFHPRDCSLPGSSCLEISQARILEWVAISFSKDLPNPGIKPTSPVWQAESLPLSHLGRPS